MPQLSRGCDLSRGTYRRVVDVAMTVLYRLANALDGSGTCRDLLLASHYKLHAVALLVVKGHDVEWLLARVRSPESRQCTNNNSCKTLRKYDIFNFIATAQ